MYKLIGGALIAVTMGIISMPITSWAGTTSNDCKPDINNPDVLNRVVCTWPEDPSVTPAPDTTDCQARIRTPNTSADDCGNDDFSRCMTYKGYQCTSIISDPTNN